MELIPSFFLARKTIQNNGGKYVQEIVDGGEIVNIYHIKL